MNNKEKLELARDWYNDQSTTKKEKILLENLFPELAVSDDERIRKEMIDFLQETIDNVGESPNKWTMYNAKKWIAWLEKQDKQKYVDTDTIKKKANQIAWEISKHYDPNACKQEWCEMAALDMASWLKSLKDRVQPKQQWIREACERLENYFASDDGSMVPENVGLFQDLQRVIKGE